MNEAAKLVSEALLGLDYKTIFIGGKAYEVKSPTIKTMCLGLSEWAKIDFNLKDQTNLSLVTQIPEISKYQLRGISRFIESDIQLADKIYNEWMNEDPSVTQDEISIAIDVILGLIDTKNFFLYANSALSAARIIANPK